MPNAEENRRLSALLFRARESIEMWADVVEARTGQADNYNRQFVRAIDDYRAEHGWSPHGFGGEAADEPQEDDRA